MLQAQMSPSRRQLLQGIAAVALSPRPGPALAGRPCPFDECWVCDLGYKHDLFPLIRLADMPPGWDTYDDLDNELMAQCGPGGYRL